MVSIPSIDDVVVCLTRGTWAKHVVDGYKRQLVDYVSCGEGSLTYIWVRLRVGTGRVTESCYNTVACMRMDRPVLPRSGSHQ